MPIDARVEAEKLRTMYKENKKQQYVSVLLTGESGSGKTYITRTAPRPVHIDSFDPTGTMSVRDEIERGNIIVDTRFEEENFMSPSAFKLWTKEFEARRVGKYFESIGTYVLDSATTFTTAIMNSVQASPKGSGAGQVPVWNKDYHPQKVAIETWLSKCMTLPCHFILTAHLEPQKNDEGSIIAYRFMMTGKSSITVPLKFDEIWVTTTKETSKGIEYSVKLNSTGFYLARSRLAGTGKLKPTEPANLKEIIKKAGLDYQDKEVI